jgi:hypothetical protein
LIAIFAPLFAVFQRVKVVYFWVEHVIHMHIREVIMCFSAFMGGMKKRNKRPKSSQNYEG